MTKYKLEYIWLDGYTPTGLEEVAVVAQVGGLLSEEGLSPLTNPA